MTIDPHSRAQKLVPRHAATVMLLRPSNDGAEVLVIRRHEKLAFMGGMWVFPGGVLSPADLSPESLARIPPDSLAQCPRFRDLHGLALEPRQCLGVAVAAYRETFEETGVLLARTVEGQPCRDDLLLHMQERRRAIVSQPELFATLLAEERLLLDVGHLTYWAHWITPSNAPKRFDTRFFAVEVRPEQTATIDTVETVDHAWMTPAALLAAAEWRTMPISQPTLYNLMTLDASLRLHGSLRAMLASESQRQIAPVLPKMIRGETTVMILPWDEDYAQTPGEGAPLDIIYPTWLSALPSRMTFKF